MDWMDIGYALLLGMIILVLWPRTKQILQETRKAEAGEWMGVILPILAVLGFVVLLAMMI